jgi:putative flippase GtrA
MYSMAAVDASSERRRLLRYVVNGVVATVVHYGALSFLLEIVRMPSAGLANGLAAMIGIATSFLGSRYYVFRAGEAPLIGQATRFVALYAAIAVLHAATLWLWTDIGGLDYRLGFLVASVLQFACSYVGNRWLVFR